MPTILFLGDENGLTMETNDLTHSNDKTSQCLISSKSYREVLRQFTSGITIVTINTEEQIHGLTVSAFTSVSPEPPLVAIIIDHCHRTCRMLGQDHARYAVNILQRGQVELSNRSA
jgi:flavin reductase (DIM6/NTAB) family NADH-FMN oxidoreductase RutF